MMIYCTNVLFQNCGGNTSAAWIVFSDLCKSVNAEESKIQHKAQTPFVLYLCRFQDNSNAKVQRSFFLNETEDQISNANILRISVLIQTLSSILISYYWCNQKYPSHFALGIYIISCCAVATKGHNEFALRSGEHRSAFSAVYYVFTLHSPHLYLSSCSGPCLIFIWISLLGNNWHSWNPWAGDGSRVGSGSQVEHFKYPSFFFYWERTHKHTHT